MAIGCCVGCKVPPKIVIIIKKLTIVTGMHIFTQSVVGSGRQKTISVQI